MTRGIGKIRERSRPVKQRKTEDMKTLKLEMGQRAGKRSPGKRGRKKFPFSRREIANPGIKGVSPKFVGKKPRQQCQCRLEVELMETELAKIKEEIRGSSESLFAAEIEANQAEARLELLITTRNELMENLLKIKAAEAVLLRQLGFF